MVLQNNACAKPRQVVILQLADDADLTQGDFLAWEALLSLILSLLYLLGHNPPVIPIQHRKHYFFMQSSTHIAAVNEGDQSFVIANLLPH